MLNLTNAQADELARDLEQLQPLLRELAGHHAHRFDAMRYIGEDRLARFAELRRDQVLAHVDVVDQVVKQLRGHHPASEPGRRRWTTPAGNIGGGRRAG